MTRKIYVLKKIFFSRIFDSSLVESTEVEHIGKEKQWCSWLLERQLF